MISQNVSGNLKLTKLNGRTVTLSEYLKKGPVLINFWATWCSPCKKEMVYLDKFERKYKDEGLSILSISDTATLIGFFGTSLSIPTGRYTHKTSDYKSNCFTGNE